MGGQRKFTFMIKRKDHYKAGNEQNNKNKKMREREDGEEINLFIFMIN